MTGRDRLTRLTREAVRKMETRLGSPGTRWPEALGDLCARGRLRRGPWFIHTCLTHVLAWLDGSTASPKLVHQLTRARDIVSRRTGPGGLSPLLDL